MTEGDRAATEARPTDQQIAEVQRQMGPALYWDTVAQLNAARAEVQRLGQQLQEARTNRAISDGATSSTGMSTHREDLESAEQASKEWVARMVAEGYSIEPVVAERVAKHGDYLMAMARSWIANGDEHHGHMLGSFVLAAQWWAANRDAETLLNQERDSLSETLASAIAQRDGLRRQVAAAEALCVARIQSAQKHPPSAALFARDVLLLLAAVPVQPGPTEEMSDRYLRDLLATSHDPIERRRIEVALERRRSLVQPDEQEKAQ